MIITRLNAFNTKLTQEYTKVHPFPPQNEANNEYYF